MPRLLPRTLGPPMQQRQMEELFLGRIQPLDEALVLLLEDLDLTLKIVDEGNKVLLGQVVQISDDGQNNLPVQSGSGLTLGHQGMAYKKNLSNR